VQAFAGRDTIIVVNQPLQLNATGGVNYFWTPAIGMSNVNIPNPVVKLGANVDSIRYVVRVSTAEGCFATDDIWVRVFKTAPDIFVPSAFTPNKDGKNDILRPLAIGMKSLTYFRVYNRWGQMLYSTSEIGKGWDGTFAGKEQGSGTFVYVAEAIDYLDNKVVRKGTAVLIR
jgi:gliding motility-associated-like protein